MEHYTVIKIQMQLYGSMCISKPPSESSGHRTTQEFHLLLLALDLTSHPEQACRPTPRRQPAGQSTCQPKPSSPSPGMFSATCPASLKSAASHLPAVCWDPSPAECSCLLFIPFLDSVTISEISGETRYLELDGQQMKIKVTE